jgi:threonine-phosphate decarboxylase
MSNNINPLGPPPGLLEYLKSNISMATRLPEVDSADSVKRFAGYLGIDADCILAANGTTQFIYAIPQALATRRAVIVGPTYADYADACSLHKVPFTIATTEESAAFRMDPGRIENDFRGADTVFLCNPNNPTGSFIDKKDLIALCERHPEVRFIIDESYLPFVNNGRANSMVDSELQNVIVLLSISKIFAVPGLRIGFVTAPANMIARLRPYLLPWSVNSLAQTAVHYLTENNNSVREFIDKTRRFLAARRREFDDLVKDITPMRFFPSTTPFFLIKLPARVSARSVWTCLAADKILVRDCSNFYGLSDRFIRISLKSRVANRAIAGRLAQLAETPVNPCRPSEAARMIRV